MPSSSSASPINFPCHHCQQLIYIPAGFPGTTAACPHCGNPVKFPEQEATPAPEARVPTPMPFTAPEVLEEQAPLITPVSNPEEPTRFKVDQPEPPRLPAERTVVDPLDVSPDLPRVKPEPVLNPIHEPAAINARKNVRKGRLIGVLSVLVILLLVGGVMLFLSEKTKDVQSAPAPVVSSEPSTPAVTDDAPEEPVSNKIWEESDWRENSAQVLGGFLEAATPEGKMKYVIPHDDALENIEIYFPVGKENTDSSLSEFTVVNSKQQDRENGIFHMHYNRSPQVSTREYFTPLESQSSVSAKTEASLITMASQVDEESLSEPLRINAFFKKTEDGLKLDSSVFIQGKFRTFKAFTEYPQSGKSKVFRVVVSEVLSHELREEVDVKTYKVYDFTYNQDFVNFPVEVDSEVGKILSVLNWRGTNKRVFPRTATLELEWTEGSPSNLVIKSVLCWEFLGVGGELGNTGSKQAKGLEPAVDSSTSN